MSTCDRRGRVWRRCGERSAACNILQYGRFDGRSVMIFDFLCYFPAGSICWGIAGTPLHAAVSKGHLSCLQVLLAHGALVDCVDVKAQTPLFAATTSSKNTGQVNWILRYSAPRPRIAAEKGGWGIAGTPLHAAVSKGHLSCLQVLLAHGALVDCVDVKAQTPLFAATTSSKNTGQVNWILEIFSSKAEDSCRKVQRGGNTVNDVKDRGEDRSRNPMALTSQCRLAVRRYLQKINKIHCMDQLEIPTSLLNFLQYKSVPVTVL
uniref:SOCS box domain-containing protein n=1 Tax=Anabas testudineus TaxID=64144 RepID=A0A3Q1H3D5_ANATE